MVTLGAGDLLICYTDGLSEAFDDTAASWLATAS
jgi:hypothetical protein